MKKPLFALSLALCAVGCAHTDKEWSPWSKLQIQSPGHGTFSPEYFVGTAKEYLKSHQIAVDEEQPIVDVYVSTPERMALVKFRQGAEHVCAVEIGPDGTAVRHQDIRVGR